MLGHSNKVGENNIGASKIQNKVRFQFVDFAIGQVFKENKQYIIFLYQKSLRTLLTSFLTKPVLNVRFKDFWFTECPDIIVRNFENKKMNQIFQKIFIFMN